MIDRVRRAASLSLVLVAVALLDCARVPPTSATWSAMTFNVLYDATEWRKTLDVIGSESADIVCVQEVTMPFVTAFEARYASTWPYRQFESRTGTWGIGLASKHPLRDVEVFEQKPHRMPAMEAVTTIGGQEVRVVCVHLFPPGAKRDPGAGLMKTMRANAGLRTEQAEALVTRLQHDKRPVLLLGDFNERPKGKAMDVLARAGFRNACRRCGSTWPGPASSWPAIAQVDHILVRDLAAVDARVVKGGGSDHYPVTASFAR